MNDWSFQFFFILIFYILFLFLKNKLFGFFDPLVPTLFSIASGLVIALKLWLLEKSNFESVIFVISSQLCFLFGFLIIGKFNFIFFKSSVSRNRTERSISGSLYFFVFIFLIIIFFSSLKAELPIFADSPSDARVVFWSSNRIAQLLFTGICFFLPILGVYYYFSASTSRLKFSSIFATAISFLLISTIGAKGTFLSLVFFIGPIKHRLKLDNRYIKSEFFLFSAALGLMGFSYFAMVSRNWSAAQNFFSKFILRLSQGGDYAYYLFTPNVIEKLNLSMNPFIYIAQLPLSLFDVRFYNHVIGIHLVRLAGTGSEALYGPNPQHLVEGIVFLGKNFFFVYSLLVGMIVSFLRQVSRNLINRGELNTALPLLGLSAILPLDTHYFMFCCAGLLIIWSLDFLRLTLMRAISGDR